MKGGDDMKKLTKTRIIAGVMTFGIVSLMALPMVVGATTADASDCGTGVGQVPCASQLGLGETSLSNLITSIITLIMGFLGIIAVLIMLWGGFIWMTAGGEQDKVDKAKKLIVSGIIGLVIIFAAYAIASFVISNLKGFTGATSI